MILILRIRDTIETLKDSLLIKYGNTFPIITNLDHYMIIRRNYLDVNILSVRRILDRIRDQIDYNLRQAVLIGEEDSM